MGHIQDQKVTTILTEQAGKYIAREAGRETLITPTRSTISRDGKNATIYVSVFPDADKDNALAFLKRHKDLFRDSLKKGTRLARLPYITFEFDYGEQNRQHLDELSQQLKDGATD